MTKNELKAGTLGDQLYPLISLDLDFFKIRVTAEEAISILFEKNLGANAIFTKSETDGEFTILRQDKNGCDMFVSGNPSDCISYVMNFFDHPKFTYFFRPAAKVFKSGEREYVLEEQLASAIKADDDAKIETIMTELATMADAHLAFAAVFARIHCGALSL